MIGECSDWKGIRKDMLKVYRRRLRVQVVQSLTDLALVAEREPEDQLEQMFTPQTLEPFLRAATGEASEEITVRHFEIAKLMLHIAHERLKPQIPTPFRIAFNRLLDESLMMLDSMEVHPQKILPVNTELRRENLLKQRQSILKKLYRTPETEKK